MPHQCVRCGKMIPGGSRQLLEGCDACKGKFFFYIREEALVKDANLIRDNLSKDEIKEMEVDVREILGKTGQVDSVVLDLETIRTLGPGKFRIDVSALMRGAPLVINISPGKYYIDLPSAFGESSSDNLFDKAFKKKGKKK